MLVLTRKVNESINIGDGIVVTVLAIEGEKVKLGIAAPREIVVLRQEVFQAIQEQEKLQELLARETEPGHLEELRKLLADENAGEQEKDSGQE